MEHCIHGKDIQDYCKKCVQSNEDRTLIRPNTVVSGAVIVWVNGRGKLFNDIPKADKYFAVQARKTGDATWERVFAPVKREHGKTFLPRKKAI